MVWEEKSKMIQMMNQLNPSAPDAPGKQEKVLDYIIPKLDKFDNQAWDMFVTGTCIKPDLIKVNLDKWLEVRRYMVRMAELKNANFKASLRFEYLKIVIRDELLKKEKQDAEWVEY